LDNLVVFFVILRSDNSNKQKGIVMKNMSNHQNSERPPPEGFAEGPKRKSVLENLITDLSTSAMQAHLATINGTYLFQQMVEGQNLVRSLRLEQGIEESEKAYGALSAARKECDTLYDEMTDDSTPYETFIRQWNGTVKLYQDMLDRKGGSTTDNGGDTGDTGNSGEAGDSGDSSGGTIVDGVDEG
jgi:hypothetical protein